MTVDRPAPLAETRPDPEDRFLRSWLLWVSLGESVGFLAPAFAQLAFGGSPVAAPTLILAGALEGTVLGWTQSTVLRTRVPALSRPRWVGATALGAAVAWFIGLLPSEWADVWQTWPATGQIVAASCAATALLASIGFAQWFELRRHLRRSLWWIPGSAAAWCAGLGVFFAVATPLWQPGESALVILLIGVLAAVLMAVAMAVVSGLIMLLMLRREKSSSKG